MEEIYEPSSFLATERRNLKEYFEDYRKLCPELIKTEKTKNNHIIYFNLARLFDISMTMEEFQQLEKHCSVDKLTSRGERKVERLTLPEKAINSVTITNLYPTNHQNKKLEVLKCKEMLEQKKNFPEMLEGRSRDLHSKIKISDNGLKQDLKEGSDFIYKILVYKPLAINYLNKSRNSKMRLSVEIEALGSNYLTELVDTIVCYHENGLYKEVDNTKADLTPLKNAKKHYPSATLFIDGVFYNDFRVPEAIDYSSIIIEWAKGKNIGKFTSKSLENVRLDSLNCRLGYPYVYLHLGECEHIVVFSDARLLSTGDSLVSKNYPYISTMIQVKNTMCIICTTAPSQWLCTNCDRFPREKVYLCTNCCDAYNFIDGKKVGNFNLYPLHDYDENEKQTQ